MQGAKGKCEALIKAFKQIPVRDTLILPGDFNSSVSPNPALIWPQAVRPTETRPGEDSLTNLLQRLRLEALNTWQCVPSYAFVQGDTRTQIDFTLVFVREPCAGSQAIWAGPILNFLLGSRKEGGRILIQAKTPHYATLDASSFATTACDT